MRLQQRQARETGICPVRRELYSQCFGEPFDVMRCSIIKCQTSEMRNGNLSDNIFQMN